jgi:hypothetical protein
MCIKKFPRNRRCQKQKDKRSDIVLERNQCVLVSFPNLSYKKRSFRFGLKSALLDQTEMISFDKTNSGTISNVLVSLRLYIERFLERSFLYCFDITRMKLKLTLFVSKHLQ